MLCFWKNTKVSTCLPQLPFIFITESFLNKTAMNLAIRKYFSTNNNNLISAINYLDIHSFAFIHVTKIINLRYKNKNHWKSCPQQAVVEAWSHMRLNAAFTQLTFAYYLKVYIEMCVLVQLYAEKVHSLFYPFVPHLNLIAFLTSYHTPTTIISLIN